MEWRLAGSALFLAAGMMYVIYAAEKNTKWYQRLGRFAIAAYDFWIAMDWIVAVLMESK